LQFFLLKKKDETNLTLRKIEFLVFDEADFLFEMGFAQHINVNNQLVFIYLKKYIRRSLKKSTPIDKPCSFQPQFPKSSRNFQESN